MPGWRGRTGARSRRSTRAGCEAARHHLADAVDVDADAELEALHRGAGQRGLAGESWPVRTKIGDPSVIAAESIG
jgi:hypothetical protein